MTGIVLLLIGLVPTTAPGSDVAVDTLGSLLVAIQLEVHAKNAEVRPPRNLVQPWACEKEAWLREYVSSRPPPSDDPEHVMFYPKFQQMFED